MRVFKKSIILFLFVLIILFLLPLQTYAITINNDIYSGALPLDEFRKKYDPEKKGRILWSGSTDENGVEHATNYILRAPPYEGARVEDIDRISLDYSPSLVYPTEEIRYEYDDPLSITGSQPYVLGTVRTQSSVKHEQNITWDEYLQERLDDGWVETTYEGLPAVEKWHDYSLDKYERFHGLSGWRQIRVLLIDDSILPGIVILRFQDDYSVSTIMESEELDETLWAKSEEVWTVELKEVGERQFKEHFDKTEVTLTRVRLYPGKLGEVPKEVKKEQKKMANAEVDTDADKNAGETGVTIPEALAIVIIGGAAAITGAGAGSDPDNGDKKKKSRYKMCLRKDFGDAIRYDTQPVTVYARIVEITPEGEEIDRPDLSARIEMFSGGGLKVESTAIADNYMGALVCAESVPGGQNPDSGVLSIRFSGEGGSFQNNVTFRLVGKPGIYFPEQGNYLTMTLPMLLGDGEVYETPVILNDFLEKPTSVRLDVAEDVPLSCKLEETEEAEEANETRYLLKVKNLSAKPETPQTVKLMFGIGILAENDKEKAEESVKAELYPEGLSIREVKFDDKGYVLIDALDQESTEEWGDVVPTDFILDFVVPEQRDDGRRIVRVLDPKDFSPAFGGLKGTDERTAHLAERFRYTIRETQGNSKEYEFAPQEALVEEKGKPYYLTLPISCAYGQEEYTLDLPIRLLGGGPGPLAGWDEAFADMKKIVSKVGGISPEIARLLRENGKKMSTAELRLVTRKICHDAIIYYTKDAAEYEQIAAELDNMLFYAEWIKWFGDQAFSYLISTYYGSTADALLSPAKDIFAAFLGEVIDKLLYDEEINLDELETIKNITAGVDNLITNAFDDATAKDSKLSFKQVCAVVAGFLVWKIGKNIYENRDKDGKIDLYSAITALTADLTVMGVKKIAGKFFDKALKNSSVQKALNNPIRKWLQNNVPNVVKGRWDIDKQGEYLFKIIEFKQSAVFKKYLEEFFGMGTAKVVEVGAEAVQDWRNSTGSDENTVDLSAWPRISWISETEEQNGQKTAFMISVDLSFEVAGKFFDHLFGELFGEVPFAAETKSPPVDPPYLPEKSFDTL